MHEKPDTLYYNGNVICPIFHFHEPSSRSVFGTVFVADLANDPAARDIELANLLLASTEFDAGKDEVVGRDSWRKFLGEIAARSVSPMKDESLMLLKRYFVASRRVRQQTMSAKGGAEIHVSAIETM